jgi:hypothetical protein
VDGQSDAFGAAVWAARELLSVLFSALSLACVTGLGTQ